jgi:hypothetical protein
MERILIHVLLNQLFDSYMGESRYLFNDDDNNNKIIIIIIIGLAAFVSQVKKSIFQSVSSYS